MLPEKWKDLVGDIKDKFKVEEAGKEHLDEEGGVDIEYIVFEGPLGLMRLEFVAKPIVLDKKTKYTKRLAAETQVDYVYSAEEKSHKLDIYKWDDSTDEWVLVDNKNFIL